MRYPVARQLCAAITRVCLQRCGEQGHRGVINPPCRVCIEMTDSASPRGGQPLTGLLPVLALLCISGIALRIPILAIPPLLPLIHDDLHMSEAQVGMLVGLPLALFALAAVPGSLLVARLGARVTLVGGLLLAGLASGARGLTGDLPSLYLATIVMGLGISVMQPALPRLVREWTPSRIGLGTAVYTNGMLIGAVTPIALTYSVVMPTVGQSWRNDLIFWAVPVLLVVAVLAIALPMLPTVKRDAVRMPDRWWPDWKSPLTWMLGLTFGTNNSIYFSLNAVLPEYLTFTGRGDLVSSSLLSINISQLVSLLILLVVADRMLLRVWPFVVFGLVAIVGMLGMIYLDGVWIVVAAAFVGFATAMTFGITLAMPPALSRAEDVSRTAAGTFTIAYAFSVVIPIICGALWDHTGLPRLAFLPILGCALGMTLLGSAMSRFKRVE
jgi:CP family cyanate transporter-like MFS transporter